MVLGKIDIHIQEKKGIEPWSYIIRKNQLKMDQTPKCKKIIKFLKETLVQKHHDSRFGNDFLAVTPKAQAMKEKNKIDFIKIKQNFSASKDFINKSQKATKG